MGIIESITNPAFAWVTGTVEVLNRMLTDTFGGFSGVILVGVAFVVAFLLTKNDPPSFNRTIKFFVFAFLTWCTLMFLGFV
jgi:multisubunit Na+/H+ antiporter MnhB subunit